MVKGKSTMVAERPVLICTKHRGVFFGYSADTTGNDVTLKRARMAIKFGTQRGVMQLAETGPTGNSKVSARADCNLRDVTAVFEVTEAAVKAWEAA